MSHDRSYNNNINDLYKQMLRIVIDYKSSYAEVLSEHESFALNHRTVQKLAMEM